MAGDGAGRVRREHQANETGNLGKGLPDDPENVPENQNIGLRVVIETIAGERLWERSRDGGLTSTAYREDGTLAAIIAALEEAIRQARGELGADDPHPVADIRKKTEAAPAEADSSSQSTETPPAVRR